MSALVGVRSQIALCRWWLHPTARGAIGPQRNKYTSMRWIYLAFSISDKMSLRHW
jgi:hypothetical protein